MLWDMQIGMIGLGRMGANMVRRLMRGGHACVVYDRSADAVQALATARAPTGAASLADLVAKLDDAARDLADGAGGGRRRDARRAASRCSRPATSSSTAATRTTTTTSRARSGWPRQGLHYVDCGTSGGVWGLERGYCLMIGGEPDVVRRLDPIFATLAPGRRRRSPRTPGRERRAAPAEHGYLHCGPSGAGHFVKMVHNGIEYGLMAAYAEGLNILKHANVGKRDARARRRDDAAAPPRALPVRLRPRRRSPRCGGAAASIASWLLDLTAAALGERSRPRRLQRARVGLGRGPLDGRRRDRRGACRRTC